MFQTYPNVDTGANEVSIIGRTKPVMTDDIWLGRAYEVPMDAQLLINGACYDYMEDDGTNPGATQKFQNAFENRYAQFKHVLTW